MSAYYNEIDPYCVAWLRNLIAGGHIAPGDVDDRSILEVSPVDLIGYDQHHFFAGLGGWSYAARLAGWPDDKPLWTGSPPCQPHSVAGRRRGTADERHLWPAYFELVRHFRPDVVAGEQVTGALANGVVDGMWADMEGVGYAMRPTVLPACSVESPHRRDRLFFVAVANNNRPRRSIVAELDGEPLARVDIQAGRHADRRRHENSLSVADANSDALRIESGRRGGAHRAGEAVDQQYGGDVVDATRERRREGRPEHEVERRRPTVAGSGGGDVGDTHGARLAGWFAGGPDQGPDAVGLSGGRDVGDACSQGLPSPELGRESGAQERRQHAGSAAGEPGCARSPWANAAWITGADGKARRVEPGICLLAHGVPNRVAQLRAFGNAIVPQVAAEVLRAYLETEFFC